MRKILEIKRRQKLKEGSSEKDIKQRSKHLDEHLEVYIKDTYWPSRHEWHLFTEEKMVDHEKQTKKITGLLIDFWKQSQGKGTTTF